MPLLKRGRCCCCAPRKRQAQLYPSHTYCEEETHHTTAVRAVHCRARCSATLASPLERQAQRSLASQENCPAPPAQHPHGKEATQCGPAPRGAAPCCVCRGHVHTATRTTPATHMSAWMQGLCAARPKLLRRPHAGHGRHHWTAACCIHIACAGRAPCPGRLASLQVAAAAQNTALLCSITVPIHGRGSPPARPPARPRAPAFD